MCHYAQLAQQEGTKKRGLALGHAVTQSSEVIQWESYVSLSSMKHDKVQ